MNPMQNTSQMYDMYGMQIMKMQSMYKMMHMTYQMMNMHNMYLMMNMQGMYPKTGINEMSQMNPMYMRNDNRQFPIPMLVNLVQVSPNQIEINYDIDVDVMLGMKATNYWVQDIRNLIPEGIATLGSDDTVNAGNSLSSSLVKIEQKNGSAKTFTLTFTKAIPTGAEYMLIVCYVTVKGAPPFSGDNGMATFIGK
jgi:hypothetical protein